VESPTSSNPGSDLFSQAARGGAVVSLTPKAVGKVEKHGGLLRIHVSAGGCSGMNYEFSFAPSESNDTVVEQDGVKIAIDPKAVLFIRGSEIDWHQTLMEAGFRVKNPNATASCNCGTSFSTF
jgi:iron-sulfur cluster assembly accessory protein